MPQPLLPMFPADVTEINELVSFAKRAGTVYYFNGPMPVFSHAEADRASFRMFSSQLIEWATAGDYEVAVGCRAAALAEMLRKSVLNTAGGCNLRH